MRSAFRKFHGLGNDFLIVEGDCEELDRERVIALCDRHTGVGADGILLRLDSDEPGVIARMVVYNADGSRPQMCGNGLRCFAHHLALRGETTLLEFSVATDAGPKRCTLAPSAPDAGRRLVSLDMGRPSFERSELPMRGEGLSRETVEVLGADWVVYGVSMGNPHAVIFVEGPTRPFAEASGGALAVHPLFPEGANVEFVRLIGEREVEVTVYERGCGITQACGTGACAVAAVLARDRGWTGRELSVRLPGGVLTVFVDAVTGEIRLTGPSELVYDGFLPERWR